MFPWQRPRFSQHSKKILKLSPVDGLEFFLAKEIIFHASEVHLCGQMSWDQWRELQSWWSLLGVGAGMQAGGRSPPAAEALLGRGPKARDGEQRGKDSGMRLSSPTPLLTSRWKWQHWRDFPTKNHIEDYLVFYLMI